MTSHFNANLRRGAQGETVVRRWLEGQSFYVTPTSFVKDPESVAPSMTRIVNGEKVVLMDLLASCRGASRWIEVKTKSEDVFYNIRREWRQGIEERHFNNYLMCEQVSGIPGYLAFLVLRPFGDAAKPITLRFGKLSHMLQHKRWGEMERKPHVFFPSEMLESYEVTDSELIQISPGWQQPNVNPVWKPKTGSNEQQEYFDFGSGEEKRRVI